MAKSGDSLLELVRVYMQKKAWTVLPTDVLLCIASAIDSQVDAGILGAALAVKRVTASADDTNSVETVVDNPIDINDVINISSTTTECIYEIDNANPSTNSIDSNQLPLERKNRTVSRWPRFLSTLCVGLGCTLSLSSVAFIILIARRESSGQRLLSSERLLHYSQLLTQLGVGVALTSHLFVRIPLPEDSDNEVKNN